MLNKNKKIAIIVILTSLIIIIGTVLLILVPTINNNKIKESLSNATIDFYENHYYDYLENPVDDLKVFETNGIKIRLSNLVKAVSVDKRVTNKCSLTKTEVIIYPESPFGKNNYRIELKTSCK